jgi:hypothetical protein
MDPLRPHRDPRRAEDLSVRGPIEAVDLALPACAALIVLLLSAATFGAHAHQHGGTDADKTETVLLAEIGGLIAYMIVGGLSGFLEGRLEREEERESHDQTTGPMWACVRHAPPTLTPARRRSPLRIVTRPRSQTLP